MDKASLFQSIGLSEQKAKETVKNEVLSARLESIINLVRNIISSSLFCNFLLGYLPDKEIVCLFLSIYSKGAKL